MNQESNLDNLTTEDLNKLRDEALEKVKLNCLMARGPNVKDREFANKANEHFGIYQRLGGNLSLETIINQIIPAKVTEYDTRVLGKVPKVNSKCRVLIINKCRLGDTVMTLPLLSALPKKWNKTFLASFPQAVVAEQFVNNVIDIDNNEINYSSFDLAINTLYDPDGIIGKSINERIKTVITSAFMCRPNMHMGSVLLSALAPLGITEFDIVPKLPVKTRKKTKTVAFHPSSGAVVKNWPIERWVEFVKQMDAPALLISGPKDDSVTAEFISKHPCTQVLRGSSVIELSERLAECALFIGHDTGVTHLAAAVGTPTIALFAGSNPTIWAPKGKHVRVITPSTLENIQTNVFTMSDIKKITVEFLLKEASQYYKQILSGSTIHG